MMAATIKTASMSTLAPLRLPVLPALIFPSRVLEILWPVILGLTAAQAASRGAAALDLSAPLIMLSASAAGILGVGVSAHVKAISPRWMPIALLLWGFNPSQATAIAASIMPVLETGIVPPLPLTSHTINAEQLRSSS